MAEGLPTPEMYEVVLDGVANNAGLSYAFVLSFPSHHVTSASMCLLLAYSSHKRQKGTAGVTVIFLGTQGSTSSYSLGSRFSRGQAVQLAVTEDPGQLMRVRLSMQGIVANAS